MIFSFSIFLTCGIFHFLVCFYNVECVLLVCEWESAARRLSCILIGGTCLFPRVYWRFNVPSRDFEQIGGSCVPGTVSRNSLFTGTSMRSWRGGRTEDGWPRNLKHPSYQTPESDGEIWKIGSGTMTNIVALEVWVGGETECNSKTWKTKGQLIKAF